MASPTTTKNPPLRRGQSGGLSFAAPPSPYSHPPRPAMHAVQPQPPLTLQQSPTTEYPPQRTPPAAPGSANLNQAPMIAPMYGSAVAVAGVPQGTPHSVRRVPAPHYASSGGDAGWGVSEDLRAGEVAVSDIEKGESPYAPIVAQSLQRLETRHSPRDRDRGSPQQAPDAQAGSSMKPLPAAAPTRGPRVPATTPTRAHSFPQPQAPQAPLQRTQQPSPPTSIAGGRDMYYQPQQQQQVLHRHHTSDSSDSSSPPFKYDGSQGQQQPGHPGLQRQNSRQLLKTRTPDRSLPFKEEADNDNDHDPEPVRKQPHRLSGQWAGSTTVYDTEAGYGGVRQPDPPQYGGLAHRSPDDTAVDDDLDDDDSEPAANPPGVPASRSNLAELKNMSHHLQEPHEAAAAVAAGADSHSSGTPRSPSTHLPAGMSLAMAQSLMNGDSVLSTSSAGAPLGHLAYDITTDRFDPDVFQNSTLQQLREPLPPPVANNTRYPAQHQHQQARVPQQPQQQAHPQQQYQRFPVYTNNETIAAQLHKMLQMDDLAAMPSMAASPVYAHYAQHQHQQHQHQQQSNHSHTNGSSAASHHQHPARPDAPEPPTPQEPRGTPYPYTYGLTGYDAQLAMMRAQAAAAAQAGSDSAFSPATTPYPVGGPMANWFPFLPPHVYAPTARSSPTQSHFDPAGAPFFPGARMAAMAKRKKRNWHSVVVPPRGESTAPPETEYSGDEFTEAQTEIHDDDGLEEERGADEWVDVSDEEDEDLLALEFHPTYVASAERRRKKFDKKWASLVKAFREVDRMTDATMVLLAAPPDAHHLLSLSSRAIRRGEAEHATHSPHISTMRASFARLAAQRAAARGSAGISLSDRLAQLSVAGNGGGGNEEALRKALESALASIGMLGRMYEEREARLQSEMLRQAQDRESVEFVLRQALAGTGS